MEKANVMLKVLKGSVRREEASYRYYYNAFVRAEITAAKSLLLCLAE